jgi:hypothetical protein
MTDIITQAINEASTSSEFVQAALLVEHHIKSDRDPDVNAGLVAHLAYRGHALIHAWAPHSTTHERSIARYSLTIAAAIVRILDLEVKAHNGTQRP